MTTTTTRGGRHDRFGRYRPDPTSPEQTADRLAAIRRLAGLEPCQHTGCDQPSRERFGTVALCRPHTVEAMATAYAMEIGGAL